METGITAIPSQEKEENQNTVVAAGTEGVVLTRFYFFTLIWDML